MVNRKRISDMSIQERDAFFAREDVKGFIDQVRSCIKEKRALTNVGLTIPDIMLPMIRQIATETSKPCEVCHCTSCERNLKAEHYGRDPGSILG